MSGNSYFILDILEKYSKYLVGSFNQTAWDSIETDIGIPASNLNIVGLLGGWCDFSTSEESAKKSMDNIAQQISLMRQLHINEIRLFVGRDKYQSLEHARTLSSTLRAIKYMAQKYPETQFTFETHGGISNIPDFMELLVSQAPNLWITLDPGNLIRYSPQIDPFKFIYLASKINCIHVKGWSENGFQSYCTSDEGLRLMPELIKQFSPRHVILEEEGMFVTRDSLLNSFQLLKKKVF